MLDKLLRRLGVRAGERQLVLRFTLLHFVLIASYTIARTARDALFLGTLGAQWLPELYVALALWTALVSTAYARLGLRKQLQGALSACLVVCAIVLGAFGVILLRSPSAVSTVALYLWIGAYGLLLISLFWVLVNEATDPREAKRLYSIIGGGGIVGGLAGGVAATLLGRVFGPERTLFVAAAALVAVAPFTRHLVDPNSSRVLDLRQSAPPPPGWQRDRYVLLLSALFLLGGITAGLLDYQFKVVVQATSGGNAKQLTWLLGSYHTVLNALAIVLQVFASAWLLRRAGAVSVAGMWPAGVVVGSAVALLQPASAIFVAATRMYEAGMRISLAKTAWEFFFFPLAPGLRRRVKTWIDAVIDRSADAIAGLLILGLGALGLATPRMLGWVTIVFATTWFVLTLRLRRAYVDQLSASLRALVVTDAEPEGPPEARMIEEAHRLLESTFEKRALYAFDLLERLDPDGLAVRLGALQNHPSAAIRARTLARLADPIRPIASPLLRNVAHDESVEVRTEAFRLYAQRYADTDAQMELLLQSSDEAARSAAITYLVSNPGAPESQVDARIDALLRDGGVADRVAVAAGLGRRPRPTTLHARLADLLHDPDPEVRREALHASAATGVRELVPAMLPLLATNPTREVARQAIAAFGRRVAGTLGDALADEAISIGVRRELPIVLSAIGTQDAANELLRASRTIDPLLRHRLLKAQNEIRLRDPAIAFPRASVHAALDRDVEAFLRLHMHLEMWTAEKDSRTRLLLHESLAERRDGAFRRIFRRLGLLYPPREIEIGYRALMGDVRRTRGQALEYLEAALLPEDRRLLVPLFEEPERRAILAESLYKIVPYTRESSLAELLAGPDAWLQVCALYVAGSAHVVALRDRVRAAADNPSAIVRETAQWSLRRLETA